MSLKATKNQAQCLSHQERAALAQGVPTHLTSCSALLSPQDPQLLSPPFLGPLCIVHSAEPVFLPHCPHHPVCQLLGAGLTQQPSSRPAPCEREPGPSQVACWSRQAPELWSGCCDQKVGKMKPGNGAGTAPWSHLFMADGLEPDLLLTAPHQSPWVAISPHLTPRGVGSRAGGPSHTCSLCPDWPNWEATSLTTGHAEGRYLAKGRAQAPRCGVNRQYPCQCVGVIGRGPGLQMQTAEGVVAQSLSGEGFGPRICP